jgi:hypothetical protein
MAPDAPATANVLIDARGGSAGTAEIAVTGCTIQHSSDSPDSANIRFIGTDDDDDRHWGNLTVGNNVLSDVQINVDIQGARGVSIVGNTFWRGVQYNLRIEQSSNVVVGPNVFDRNPPYRDEDVANNGLLFSRCNDSTIHGLHVNGVRRSDAAVMLVDCCQMNLSACTVLNSDHAGLLLKNTINSRVSDCLLSNRRSQQATWQAIKVVGGQENMIVDNLVVEN